MKFSTRAIPKVIGGDGKDAAAIADALYSTFVPKTVPVSSPETAEAVKLTENIFRSVNIALVNELKVVYAAMGIDVWEVIDAAKTKPFGFMPFYPGPGLGGHCIPIDPFYLTWKAREYELSTRFIELAGEINTAMPRYVVSRIADELDTRAGKGLNGGEDPDPRPRLQEERRRHPREPGIQADRAAGKARRDLRRPRSLRAGGAELARASEHGGPQVGAARPGGGRRLRRRPHRHRPRLRRLRGPRQERPPHRRHPQRLRPRGRPWGTRREGVTR